MIVRIWWPLQEAVRRRRLYAIAALAGLLAGALLGAARLGWSRPLLLAAVGGGLAVMAQVHGVAAQAMAGVALLAALTVTTVCGGGGSDLAVLAPSVALLLGSASEIARRRPAHQVQHGIGRGTTVLALGVQFALVGALDRPALLPGLAVAAVLGIVLVLPLANHAAVTTGGEPLGTPTGGRHNRWMVPLVLAVPVLALAWQPAGTPLTASQMWPVLIPAAVMWALMTMSPGLAVGAILGTAAGAAAVIAAGLGGDRAAIGAAQVVPLLVWMGRAAQGGVSWPVQFGAAAVLSATALIVPGWMPGSLIALGTVIGLACCPAPRPRPGTGLEAIRRWLHRLDPYWRWYGVAKLRLDPLYGQLAADARPWGRVLDLGCGPGLGAALAASRAGTSAYHGIDLDHDKLLVARRVLHLAAHDLDNLWRLEQATAPLSAPPSGPFDTVLLLDVLHYWPPEVQAAVLHQVHGLLADDGVLWLRDGVSGDGRVAHGERFTTWIGLNPRGGLHFLAEGGLRDLLRGCGFIVTGVAPSGGDNRLFSARKSLGHAAGEAVGEAGHERGEAGQPAAGT